MSLPRKLKNMMLFNEGNAYLTQVSSVTLPKLSRKTEEWRGGGMNAPVELDMGMEALALEWTIGGHDVLAFRQFAVTDTAGLGLRFAGAYERDEDGSIDRIEVIVRGFHKEVDSGEAKVGELGETKVTSAISYYKYIVNGVTEIEIDILNMVEAYRGRDVLAETRRAIGI